MSDTCKVKYELVKITPELAEQMLGRNSHNRGIRQRLVASYAADMTAGKWDENGETIKVAVDGTLIDGQHRLHAIVASETTQPMVVCSGLPLRVQDTVDVGARRSFADVLKLRGETNYVDLASTTRKAYLWKSGVRRRIGGAGGAATTHQLLATLDAHPELRVSAEVATRVGRRLPVQRSVMGLCHWLFSQAGPDDVDVFFENLSEGANLHSRSPIFVLRRQILDSNRTHGRTGINDVLLTVLMIKAWNAYINGDEIVHLRWRQGGAAPEAFPEPHGPSGQEQLS